MTTQDFILYANRFCELFPLSVREGLLQSLMCAPIDASDAAPQDLDTLASLLSFFNDELVDDETDAPLSQSLSDFDSTDDTLRELIDMISEDQQMIAEHKAEIDAENAWLRHAESQGEDDEREQRLQFEEERRELEEKTEAEKRFEESERIILRRGSNLVIPIGDEEDETAFQSARDRLVALGFTVEANENEFGPGFNVKLVSQHDDDLDTIEFDFGPSDDVVTFERNFAEFCADDESPTLFDSLFAFTRKYEDVLDLEWSSSDDMLVMPARDVSAELVATCSFKGLVETTRDELTKIFGEPSHVNVAMTAWYVMFYTSQGSVFVKIHSTSPSHNAFAVASSVPESVRLVQTKIDAHRKSPAELHFDAAVAYCRQHDYEITEMSDETRDELLASESIQHQPELLAEVKRAKYYVENAEQQFGEWLVDEDDVINFAHNTRRWIESESRGAAEFERQYMQALEMLRDAGYSHGLVNEDAEDDDSAVVYAIEGPIEADVPTTRLLMNKPALIAYVSEALSFDAAGRMRFPVELTIDGNVHDCVATAEFTTHTDNIGELIRVHEVRFERDDIGRGTLIDRRDWTALNNFKAIKTAGWDHYRSREAVKAMKTAAQKTLDRVS